MIAILDYDAGNIKSVEKAFNHLGEETVLTRDYHEILRADKVVLPGVGSFGDAMAHLKHYELDKAICDVVADGKPFLGICLGAGLGYIVDFQNIITDFVHNIHKIITCKKQ